jgi:DNA-directed RNA polymerase subunit RPC12/RpoP
MLNKDVSLEISCPKCSSKFKKTIRELEGNPLVKCPNGHEIQIKSDELTKGLKYTENSLEKFKENIKRMFR